MTSQTESAAIAEVLSLEAERCRALTAGDWGAVEKLLAPELTHILMTGDVRTRDGYMNQMRTRGANAQTERGPLTVRVYGDTAVMNGRQFNTPRPGEPTVESEVTQVWARKADSWQMVAFQISRVAGPAA